MSDFVVEGSSFAECWLLAARFLLDSSGKEASPFLVKIRPSEQNPQFQVHLEHDLDELLTKKIKQKYKQLMCS